MAAVSIAQQRLMAKAYECKIGKSDYCPPKIQRIVDSMSKKDIKDFAQTKHDGLPNRVSESTMYKVNGANPTIFTMLKDWLTKKNVHFIEHDGEFEILNTSDLSKDDQYQLLSYINKIGLKKVWENVSVGGTSVGDGTSTLGNTLGINNVNPPELGKPGSGDKFDNTFGNSSDIKKKKKKFKNK